MTSDSDIEAMLDRVIVDVFQGKFVTSDVVSVSSSWIRSVEVISPTRTVIVSAGRAWIGASIPQLDVGAAMVDEDDDISWKEEELRKLCRALDVYLGGAGDVKQRRRLFGRGSAAALVIEVDGFTWRFGRRSWRWAHPA